MAKQNSDCWLGINGKKFGPMSEQDVLEMYHKKKIPSNVKFFRTGMKEWGTLAQSGLIGPVVDDDGVPPLPEETSLPMMDNERILKNIDKFSETKECKCLLCGYKGLMGVVRSKTNLFLAIIIMVCSAVVTYAVFYFVFFSIMESIDIHLDSKLTSVFSILILLAVLRFAMDIMRSLRGKKVLFCPNCEKEIVEK